MLVRILGLLLLFIGWYDSFSQVTIWSENFNSYSNGTSTGANNNTPPTTADWTSGGCTSTCLAFDDYWEVRSGAMEARDVDAVAFLQSEAIDISGFSNVQFSVDVSETGDHEGPYISNDICTDEINEDFVNVLFRINGGSWTLIGNDLGWCGLYASCNTHTLYGDDGSSGDCRSTDADWGSVTVSQTGLSGSTLEIRMEVANSAGAEYIMIDNILVQGTAILPIELLSFEARVENNKVRLDWRTATEINNDFFTIERSRPPNAEGFIWEVVTTLPGAGNSESVIDYTDYDRSPYLGKSFYRLKQTDYDGQFSYSEIVSVTVNGSVVVYPNPANDRFFIQMNPEEIQQSKITLRNLLGQQLTPALQRGEQKMTVLTNRLGAGVYLLQITNSNNTITERITIAK